MSESSTSPPFGTVKSDVKAGSLMGKTDINSVRDTKQRRQSKSKNRQKQHVSHKKKYGKLSSGDKLSERNKDLPVFGNDSSIHEESSDAEESSSLIHNKGDKN